MWRNSGEARAQAQGGNQGASSWPRKEMVVAYIRVEALEIEEDLGCLGGRMGWAW